MSLFIHTVRARSTKKFHFKHCTTLNEVVKETKNSIILDLYKKNQ